MLERGVEVADQLDEICTADVWRRVNLQITEMAIDSSEPNASVPAPNWREELPTLTSRAVTLREPAAQDLGPLFELLSAGDAGRFEIEDPVTELFVKDFIERARRARAAGQSFTYVVILGASRSLVGVVQVRQLDPTFEAGEWDGVLVPSSRGTGVFLEAARLVGSFAFGPVGVHRLEARVLRQNGRANGALRKIGAVQEGVLRRSVRRGDEYLDQVLWSVLKDDWADHWVSVAPRVH
jgi:RimJ/RimL family protein N-acetyltransferase